jgi:hypothetical protein
MSYVITKACVRTLFLRCLVLISVLMMFVTLFCGVADTCHNECENADDASCYCACHTPVVTPPVTVLALYTEYTDNRSGDPHSPIIGPVVTDIFRPPIA